MASDTHDISIHLFNQAGVGFILEAYAAAQFADIREAESVRLISAPRPDFQVRTSVGDEDWELTEADEPGRKRGDEYKENAALAAAGQHDVKHDPVKNWQARAAQIPVVLKERATKKAAKNYRPDTRLLIYLNIIEYNAYRKETEALYGRCNCTGEVGICRGVGALEIEGVSFVGPCSAPSGKPDFAG